MLERVAPCMFATNVLCLLPLLSVFVMCTASCLAFFVPAGLLPLLSVFVLSLLCCALPAGLYCHERMVMSVCVRACACVCFCRCPLACWTLVCMLARFIVQCCRVSLFSVAAFIALRAFVKHQCFAIMFQCEIGCTNCVPIIELCDSSVDSGF